MPRLIVIKGTDEGKQFALGDDLVPCGRDSTSRLRLTDTEASRRHAEFVRTPQGYRVRDLGSANGTFVNSQSVRDVLLQVGDQVQIGQTVMVYTADLGEAAPPTDLASQISLIARQEGELSIVKTITEGEGSRILAHPEQVQGEWLKTALATNLGVIYEATQAVSHTLDIDRLMERILELVLQPIPADRGCIMLHGAPPEPGETSRVSSADLLPKAVRWRNRKADPEEKLPVSRTIMDHVLTERQGILVSDAARDERFQAVQSIVRSGVREVLCVPLKGRHETLGVLYLDTTTPAHRLLDAGLRRAEAEGGRIVPGKLTGDHLALAGAIAHLAALAVEETRYYQAMVQAERLAAVGQTIAALSHHIKNILQGLRTGGELLETGIRDKDDAFLRQGWRIVQKNQGKIYDLVMDMLSYSKEREPSIEPTDLNGVAREVVELLAGRARERGAALDLKLDPSLPEAPADREGVHRALLNIVGNALDAVEGVESARVLVGTTQEADENGGWVRLHVRDNGQGIPAEKQAEIFRPFVSTKGARGTGLGLAVSRKILREHGGDIVLESRVGKGSIFTLRLPLRSPLGGDPQRTRHDLPVTPPEPD